MDEEHTSIAGWIAGVFGVLLALVAWGREFFKHRHEREMKKTEVEAKSEEKHLDVTSDVAKSLLSRIVALEAREEKDRSEAVKREDTLRVRIEAVEKEADECQQAHAVLKEKHSILLREVEDIREENTELRSEIGKLRSQNAALHSELQTLYRSIGVKRPSAPALPAASAPASVVESSASGAKKRE